jgi:hypothetical protein
MAIRAMLVHFEKHGARGSELSARGARTAGDCVSSRRQRCRERKLEDDTARP